MSTQKQKFELFRRLGELGFTYEESAALRRIEMTLHRWFEMECGVESKWQPGNTLAIERDENDRPFMRRMGHIRGQSQWSETRYQVADREAGARRRLKAIVDARNARETALEKTLKLEQTGLTYKQAVKACSVTAYVQSDPRGCALYIVRVADIPRACAATGPATFESRLEQYYNRGVAVAA